jgi:chorismate-pyruvate lyase
MVQPEKVTPLRISSEARVNVRETALKVEEVPVVAGTKITKSAVVKVVGRSVMRQGRSSVQSNGATGDRSTT